MLKVNIINIRKRGEICSKLLKYAQTIKRPEWCHWPRSGVFIVDLEHISHLFLMFLLLTLYKEMLAGQLINCTQCNNSLQLNICLTPSHKVLDSYLRISRMLKVTDEVTKVCKWNIYINLGDPFAEKMRPQI